MDKIIKNILLKIEDEGFEAYLVGGFVRDYLLGRKTYDVDICTNALPAQLHKIFPNSNNSNKYGGFNLKVKHYNIDITTYRKEIKYENRKPTFVVYISNLLEDLKRRDFTINAICMDESERILDPLSGMADLQNRKIVLIGDILKKLTQDPLRILRAIRFSTILDFDIDINLYQTIKDNINLVATLSKQRVKDELNKILLSDNYKKGLKIIKDLKLDEVLGLKYDIVIKCSDINMMWAQIETDKIPFTKVEKNYIIRLKELMVGGVINQYTLFKYGLYLNTIVSEYLGIDKKYVNKLYKKMPITNNKDLNISSNDIMENLNIKPGSVINNIKNHLINKVLKQEIKNDRKVLIKYIVMNKSRWQDE